MNGHPAFVNLFLVETAHALHMMDAFCELFRFALTVGDQGM